MNEKISGVTHEFRNIFERHLRAKQEGLRSVLATVVDLDGSSYRKPGVRMLILENGEMEGAVSGGCVEKEVLRNARKVFESGQPAMMQYDGRFRLGCEGVLYILLEPFDPNEVSAEHLHSLFSGRCVFSLHSYYQSESGTHRGIGTVLIDGEQTLSLGPNDVDSSLKCFKDHLKPGTQLIIFGAEHDTVVLSSMASQLGWDVKVVVGLDDPQQLSDFPGAKELIHSDLSSAEDIRFDSETVVVVMSHNYARDLKCLLNLSEYNIPYIGLLGPVKRREKLFYDLMERKPEISEDFLDVIHGPAGLDIGSITPQEIALSILSEILAVQRKKELNSLKDKAQEIHERSL